MSFCKYYINKFLSFLRRAFDGLDGRQKAKNVVFLASFVLFVGLGLYMFVSYSTETAYNLVSAVETSLGLKSNATRLEGDNSDLNDDVVEDYSIYSNVCSSTGMDGTNGGNPCTIVSASTPESPSDGLAYNSLSDVGKLYNTFFYNETAVNMNQSAFFLNNKPGEQNKESGYFWELSTSESGIAKFFSIFENAYDFSIRKGTESYREDSGEVCDVASANFCYFKISDEKYINYYQVNFENRYILNSTSGGYYYITPSNNYETHYETISTDYKGIYIKEEYSQETTDLDANGKKYGESGFNSSSYYKGGYYYLYDSSTYRFDKFSLNQSNYIWLNLSSTSGINNGYNASHYYTNSNGELYVLINDKDESTLRRYYEYDESVTETYLSATLGDVAYYSSTINPNDSALSNEEYFQTGNFKWFNYFTLEQPIFKGEAWISEDYYTSDPNNNSSLTENGNYSFTYLASKYQNEYVRNYAKLMNSTWFWGNSTIGYKNGYYYDLTSTKEEYSIWNKILNTISVVLPTTGEKDYYYYSDSVNSSQICNASSAYVGYECYKYELSSNLRLFVQYGISDLFDKWKSISTEDWTNNNLTTSNKATGYDTNATNVSTSEKVGDVYVDSNGYFRINKGTGYKYSFSYKEYNWSSPQTGTYYPQGTSGTKDTNTSGHSSSTYQDSTNKYSGGSTEYYNLGTVYAIDKTKSSLKTIYAPEKLNTTVLGSAISDGSLTSGTKFLNIGQSSTFYDDYLLKLNGSATLSSPVEQQYAEKHLNVNDSLVLTFPVFYIDLYSAHRSEGWGTNCTTMSPKAFQSTNNSSFLYKLQTGDCSNAWGGTRDFYWTSGVNYLSGKIEVSYTYSQIKSKLNITTDTYTITSSDLNKLVTSTNLKTLLSTFLSQNGYTSTSSYDVSYYSTLSDAMGGVGTYFKNNTPTSRNDSETKDARIYFTYNNTKYYQVSVKSSSSETSSKDFYDTSAINSASLKTIKLTNVKFYNGSLYSTTLNYDGYNLPSTIAVGSNTMTKNTSNSFALTNYFFNSSLSTTPSVSVDYGTYYDTNVTTSWQETITGNMVSSGKTRYKYTVNGTADVYKISATGICSKVNCEPYGSTGEDWTVSSKPKTANTTTFKDSTTHDFLTVYSGTYYYRYKYSTVSKWTGTSKSGFIIYNPDGKLWTTYNGTYYSKDDNSYLIKQSSIASLFTSNVTINNLDTFKTYFKTNYTDTSENSSAYKIDSITFSSQTISAYKKERINLYHSVNTNDKTYYFANKDFNYTQKNQDLLSQNSVYQGTLFNIYQAQVNIDNAYKLSGYNASYKDGYDTNAHKISTNNQGYLYTYTKYVVTNANVTSSTSSAGTVLSTSSSSASNGINGTFDGSVNETKVPSTYTNEAKCTIANGQNKCTYYTYTNTGNKQYKYKYNVYKRTTDTGTIYKNDSSIFIAGKTKNDKGYSYGSDSAYQSKTKKDITTTDTSSYSKNICSSSESARGLSDCYILNTTRKLSDYYAKIRISGKVLDHYETVTNDFVTTVSQNTNDINYNISGNYPLCKDDYLNHPNDPSLNVPCYKYNESMRKQEKEWIKYTYGEKTRTVSTERVFVNTYDTNGNYVDAVSSSVTITNLFDLEGFIRNKKFLLNSNGEIIFDSATTYENIISNTNGNYSITIYGSNLNGSVIYINGAKHVLNSNTKQTITFSSSGNLSIKINGAEFKGNIERVMLNAGSFSYYVPYGYSSSKNTLSLKKTTRVNHTENKFYLASEYKIWQNYRVGNDVYDDEFFSKLFSSNVEFKNFDETTVKNSPYYNKYIFIKDDTKSTYLDGETSTTRYKIFSDTLYGNKPVVLYYVNQYDRKTFFREGDNTNTLPTNYFDNISLKKTINIKDIQKYNDSAKSYSYYDSTNQGYITYNDIISNFSTNYGTLDNTYASFILVDGKIYFKKENKNTYLYDYAEFDIKHTYPKELTFNTESEARNFVNTLFKGTTYNATSEGNNFTNLGIGTIDQAGNFSDLGKNSSETKYRVVQNKDGKWIIQMIYAVNKDTLAFSDKAKEEFFKITNSSGSYSYNGKANTYNSSKNYYKLFRSEHSEITFEEGVEINYTNYKDATFYLFDKYKLEGRWENISYDMLQTSSLENNYYDKWTLGVTKEDGDKQKQLALLNHTFILNFYNDGIGYINDWEHNYSEDIILGFGIGNSNDLRTLSFDGDIKFYYAFNSSKLNINSSANFTDNTSYSNNEIVKYGFGTSFESAIGSSESLLINNGFEVGEMTLEEVYTTMSANGSNSNKISIEVYQYSENGGNPQEGTLNIYIPIYFRDTSLRYGRYVLQKEGNKYIVSGVQSYNSLVNDENYLVSLRNLGTDRDAFINFDSLANIQTFGNKILTFEGSGNKKDDADYGVNEGWLLSNILKKDNTSDDKIPEFILKNEGLGDVSYAGATFRASTGESSLDNGSCFLFWCWTNVSDTTIDSAEEYRAKVWQYNAVSDYEPKNVGGYSYSVYALKEFYDINNSSNVYNYYSEIQNIANSTLPAINSELLKLNIDASLYLNEFTYENGTETLVEGGYESRGTTYNNLRKLLPLISNQTVRQNLSQLLSTNYITLMPYETSSHLLQLKLSQTRYVPTINSYFDDIDQGIKNETIGTTTYILNNLKTGDDTTSVTLNIFKNDDNIGGYIKKDFATSEVPELYFLKKDNMMYVYQKIINANFISGPQSYTPYTFNYSALLTGGKITIDNNISDLLNNEETPLYQEDNNGNLVWSYLNINSFISLDTLKAQGGSLCNGGGDYCTLNMVWQTSIYDYIPINNELGYIPSNYFYGVDSLESDPYMTGVTTSKNNDYYTYDYYPALPEGHNTIEDYSTDFIFDLNGAQILKIPYFDDLDHLYLLKQENCSLLGGCTEGSAQIIHSNLDKPTTANAYALATIATWLGNIGLTDITMLFGEYRGSFELYSFNELKSKFGITPTLFGVYVQDTTGDLFGLLRTQIRPMIFVCATDDPNECFGLKDGAQLQQKSGAYLITDIVKKDKFLGYVSGAGEYYSSLGNFFDFVDYSWIDWSKLFSTNDRFYINPSMVKNQEHPWYCFGADCSDSGIEVSWDEYMNAGVVGFYYALVYYANNWNLFGAMTSEEYAMDNIFLNNPNNFTKDGITTEVYLTLDYLRNENSYKTVATSGGYYHFNTILPYVYNEDYVSTMRTGQLAYNSNIGGMTGQGSSTPVADWISRIALSKSFFDVSSTVSDVSNAIGGEGSYVDKDSRVNKTTYTFTISPLSTNVDVDTTGMSSSKTFDDLVNESIIGYDYSLFVYIPNEKKTMVGEYDTSYVNEVISNASKTREISSELQEILTKIGVTDFTVVKQKLTSAKDNNEALSYLKTLTNSLYSSPYENNDLLNQSTETKYLTSCPVGFEYEKDGKCYYTGNYQYQFSNYTTQDNTIERNDYLIKSTATIDGSEEEIMYVTNFYKDLSDENVKLIFGDQYGNDSHTSLPADMDLYFVVRPRYYNGLVGKESVTLIHTGKDMVKNPYGSRFVKYESTNSPYYFADSELSINLIKNIKEGYYDDNGTLTVSNDYNDHYAEPILLGKDGQLNVTVPSGKTIYYMFIDPVTNKKVANTNKQTLSAGNYVIKTNSTKVYKVAIFALDNDLANVKVTSTKSNTNTPTEYQDWRLETITRDFLNAFYTYSPEYQKNHTQLSLGYAPSDDYLGVSSKDVTIPDRLRLQYTVETMGITKIYFDVFRKDNLNSQSTSVIANSNVNSTINISLENGYGTNSTTYLTSNYGFNSDENALGKQVFAFNPRLDTTGTIGSKVNEFTTDFYSNNNIAQLKPENLACHSINGNNCVTNGYADYNLADSVFFSNDSTSKYGGYNLRIDEGTRPKGTYTDSFNSAMEKLKGVEYKIMYRYQYTPGGESVFLNINQDYYTKNKDSVITWTKDMDNKKDYSTLETVILNGGARPIPVWTGSGVNGSYNANGEAITFEPSYDISGQGYFIQDQWSVSENTYIIVKYINTWYLARLNENGTYGVIVNRK